MKCRSRYRYKGELYYCILPKGHKQGHDYRKPEIKKEESK